MPTVDTDADTPTTVYFNGQAPVCNYSFFSALAKKERKCVPFSRGTSTNVDYVTGEDGKGHGEGGDGMNGCMKDGRVDKERRGTTRYRSEPVIKMHRHVQACALHNEL